MKNLLGMIILPFALVIVAVGLIMLEVRAITDVR